MQVSEESFETCLKSLLFILVLYKHGWAIYLLKKNPNIIDWLIDWLIGKRILYFSNGDCNFFIHITSIFLGWLDIRNYVIKQLTTKVCPSIVLDIAATLYWNNSSSWAFSMEDEPGKYHDHSGTEEFVVVNPRGILLHF